MTGFELFPKDFLFLFTPPDSLHVVDVRVHGALMKSVRVQLASLSDGSRFVPILSFLERLLPLYVFTLSILGCCSHFTNIFG